MCQQIGKMRYIINTFIFYDTEKCLIPILSFLTSFDCIDNSNLTIRKYCLVSKKINCLLNNTIGKKPVQNISFRFLIF